MRACHLLALLLLISPAAQSAPPEVTATYNPTLDAVCSGVRGAPIKHEWKAELLARKSEFDTLWARLGPKYMAAAEAITGKAFPSEAVTARLTLCNVPSQSMAGVIVNMRFALKSFTANPVPMRYKVDVLFHEMLHLFLAANSPRGESVRAIGDECVRNHVHLLALQKAVFLRLGEREALKTVVEVDSQLPGGCYKKAWALVNATDSEYSRYVAEL